MSVGCSSKPLSELDVLVVDCQATAAAPRGRLLEIGWARIGATTTSAHTCLIKTPNAQSIPPAVTRITGISDHMLRDGIDADVAWRELSSEAARLAQQPAPTVIHFARFERPYLRALGGDVPPLDVVCTHEIARRLFPDLPRRSLRALAGYFGRGVGALRRSASHVEATAFVWRQLLPLLQAQGVSTWSELQEWLSTPVGRTMRTRRGWPMPRDVRLSVPDTPGVYRLLRTSGDVLYVGKAASLHHRVNSYFRKQSSVPERMLEMLSQVRAISFEVTPSALEAALFEADEIKRLRPPYNVALTTDDRALWFTSPDLMQRTPHVSPRCALGPFPSAEILDRFAALTRGDPAAIGLGRWSPARPVFDAGYARLFAAHPELSRRDLRPPVRLLRLGTRLWREGRRDRAADGDDQAETDRSMTAWTPEDVQANLEWIALRAAHARRRAKWLTRLVDATIVWREPGAACARLVAIEQGEILLHAAADCCATPPLATGERRSIAECRRAFTLARFDRLSVLTTELKRLTSAGAPVALRVGAAPVLSGIRLGRVLSWV